jgi:hypothetical protein
MISFKLDFDIYEGHVNTFLIGSKSLFEQIDCIITLISHSIDVDADVTYKLVELETGNISYLLNVDVQYPIQPVFGHNLTKEQIDNWYRELLLLFLGDRDKEKSINSIPVIAGQTGLDLYFIYVEIPKDNLVKLLDDFEKLSILLFRNLSLCEDER